ncbi:thioredoxin-like protein [Mrakia frigida]|uniref:thioredoxin-like protein n=1 Tax=Mrakia frigida TaxID=29902 RepID=UPI003FCBFC52
MTSAPIEIDSTKAWNEALRAATAAGETVVVDFHASWCQPCLAIAPKYTSLAASFPQAKFLRVDVDAQKAIAAKYKVSAMPTFLAIKAGQVVQTGADPAGLIKLVKAHAGPNPPLPPLPAEVESFKADGNKLFQSGSYHEAVGKYSDAIKLHPSSLLFTNRSLANLKAGNASEAVSDAREAVKLDPKNGKGFVRLGDGLVLQGGAEKEAEESYRSALELLPEGLMKNEVKSKLDGLSKL